MADKSELIFFHSIKSDGEEYNFYASRAILQPRKVTDADSKKVLEEMAQSRRDMLEECCKLIKYDLNTMYPIMKTCNMVMSDKYRNKYLVTYVADAHTRSIYITDMNRIINSTKKGTGLRFV